jgi:phage gp29-like protein
MAAAPLGNGAAGPTFPSLVDQFGHVLPSTGDPAFQPIGDPTRDIGALRMRARVIHREIPNVVVEQSWTPGRVRNAIVDLVVGLFDRPAMLHDAIASDSRVQSAMRSRSGGLLGRPLTFAPPAKLKNDETAKKCCRAWERHWPQMDAEPAMLDLLEGAHSLGFSYSQILWDTNKKIWKPYLQSFNARYSWYHWLLRCHVAVTLDGQTPITPGDGHWVLHAPYGQYRGWMRGALRAVAQWWLARGYALRDWARYCERHGFPIILLDTPFGADPQDIAAAQSQLVTIGQEDVFATPGSVDLQKYGKYDLRYLEPKDRNWQSFKELIQQCSDEITLAFLGQNLTSEVKEGSLAAARVHADVRQAILEADARALGRTLYTQVARPFAALNFGDARYAPTIQWDIRPQEDLEQKARTFQAFATALSQLRAAGVALDDVRTFARRFGLRGLSVHDVDPVQVEARLAQATGKADNAAQPELDADTKTMVAELVELEVKRHARAARQKARRDSRRPNARAARVPRAA